MKGWISGIALLALAGCATAQPTGTWVSDGRGGYCYRQGAACSYTGAPVQTDENENKWVNLLREADRLSRESRDAVQGLKR